MGTISKKSLAAGVMGALLSILLTLVAMAAIAGTVASMGWIDVGADSPHGKGVFELIRFARERAVAYHAREITPPADLASAERVRRGAGNYDAMCVNCHLAPGVEDSEIRRGLYPTPPNLSRVDGGLARGAEAAARRFWIIKHGIRASGMPAWSRGGMEDEAIWDLAAFVDALPKLTAEQYRQQVAASEGHSHAGMASHKPEAAKQAGHHHDHDAQPHRHDHH